MSAESVSKIKYLKIWDILRQETDEEHPISTPDLLARLEESGIKCDRRTLYRNIEELNECGYEVLTKVGKPNAYYVVDRSFDIPEIHILMDAVQAASFITEKKTKQLVDKIAKLSGNKMAEVLKQNIVDFETVKSSNENIYYSVNEIATAINEGLKITFQYFDYNAQGKKVYRMRKSVPTERKTYKVNPLSTVFSSDKYYLICYDDYYGSLQHYRVDRMDAVTVVEEPITQTEKSKQFDVKAHKQQVFWMFTGKSEQVSFTADKSLIDVIHDTFGGKVKISESQNETIKFTANVQVSPTFIAWCCAFGNKLKVTAPKNVVEQVRAYIIELNAIYGGGNSQKEE